MHPVIPCRGGDQYGRIALISADVLVRRVLGYERPVLRIIRVAVFRHPRCPCKQQVEAFHVQQWHLTHQGPEQLRVLGRHDAHQQSAVASALGAELRNFCDAPLDQISGHGGEVLGDFVAAFSHRLGMPTRPILAAATDVGKNVGAAPAQPQPPEHPAVPGSLGNFETAVSTK